MVPVHKNQQAALSRRMLQAFARVNKDHVKSRPTLASEILLTGSFLPAAGGASLTRAPHVHRDFTSVTVRFSDAVRMPAIPDCYDNASVRGCAMRFHLAEHVHTDILTHSRRSVAKFAGSLEATAASVTDSSAPKPKKLVLAGDPATLDIVQAPKQIPKSFATESFFGVSAYQFTNESGRVQFGRYRVLPSGPNQYLDAEAPRAKPDNFLVDELCQRLSTGPIKMEILVQLAAIQDLVNDATFQWPEERPLVDFGTVYLTGILSNAAAKQGQIIFDPIPRVDGIERSHDSFYEPRAGVNVRERLGRRAAES